MLLKASVKDYPEVELCILASFRIQPLRKSRTQLQPHSPRGGNHACIKPCNYPETTDCNKSGVLNTRSQFLTMTATTTDNAHRQQT